MLNFMSLREVRILHCSDLHIGAEFSSLGELGVQRKRELIYALEEIVRRCKSEKIEFLLIAGDLFDCIHIETQVINEVMSLFETIPETIIAISPGNHDPYCADSYYFTRKWPDNTVIFKGETEYILFEEKRVCLWGAGFRQTYHPNSLLDNNVEFPNGDWIHICVMHAELVNGNVISSYNPVTKAQIRNMTFDYLALGHIHKRSSINKESHTYFSYCGAPEGHGFDEIGDLGIYEGSISKGNCNLNFHKISRRCYCEENICLDFAENSYLSGLSIFDFVKDKLTTKYPESYKENIYRIILEGEVPEHYIIDSNDLSSRLNEWGFYSEVADRTTILIDYESLAGEQTLKGIFVGKMLEIIKDAKNTNDIESELTAKNALRSGIMAFESEVIIRDN